MKALSIKQPWANLLVTGPKDIEIRTWKTSYRGLLAIHASKTIDRRALELFDISCHPQGAIIGIGTLTACKLYDVHSFANDRPRHRNPLEWYELGLYGFVIENIRSIKPIPYKGALSLFNIPREVFL